MELGDWVLPEPLRERRITGVVQWADGRPAPRAHVLVHASKTGGWRYWMAVDVSATTDAEGRFSITLLDGVDPVRGNAAAEARHPSLNGRWFTLAPTSLHFGA